MSIGNAVGALGIPGDWKPLPEGCSHVTKKSMVEMTILVCSGWERSREQRIA